MKLSIKHTIGPRCIIEEDGRQLFGEIHEPLKNGEIVILDFDGVRQIAAPFFNIAIGQLLKDITEPDLRRRLQIEHLNETGKRVMERVIDHAARYYGDKDYRRIVDDIMEQQVKDLE